MPKQELRDAPHRPVHGLLGRMMGPFQITGAFWQKVPHWFTRLIPRFIRPPFIWLFASGCSLLLFNISRAINSNLEPVLGRCRWFGRRLRALKTLMVFTYCFSERHERLASEEGFRIDLEGADRWKKLQASDRGFILATGHIGNWEIGFMIPEIDSTRKVHLVREPEANPKTQAYLQKLIENQTGSGIRTHFAGDDPTLGVELLNALRNGEVVSLQADRPRATGRTLELELFGREFPFPEGPMALARAAGVPIVPAFSFWIGRRHYRVEIAEPIEVADTGDRKADIAEAGAKVAAAIEEAIRFRPHQWFCFRTLWPEARR